MWVEGIAVLCVLLGVVLLVAVLGIVARAIGIGLYSPHTRNWLWSAVAAGLVAAGLVVWGIAALIGARLRSAPGKRQTVPIEAVESYPDGCPKRVLAKHRSEDGEEVVFEYGCGPRGEVRHQIRPGGKICQRVIGGNTVRIYAREITGEGLRQSRLNKYWQWIAPLSLIPAEA